MPPAHSQLPPHEGVSRYRDLDVNQRNDQMLIPVRGVQRALFEHTSQKDPSDVPMSEDAVCTSNELEPPDRVHPMQRAFGLCNTRGDSTGTTHRQYVDFIIAGCRITAPRTEVGAMNM